MPILKASQTVGRALRADARNYFLAFFAAMIAAILPLPGKVYPVLIVMICLWAALCVLSAFPDKRLEGEKAFAERTIRERDEAQEARAVSEQRANALEDLLLTQFYLRVTDRLRAEGFSDASWDFLTTHPNEALIEGKEVRIKLNDAGDFVTADAQFHPRSGVLKLNISRPVQDIPQAPVEQVKAVLKSADRKNADTVLEQWLRAHASDIEDAGFEANKKGKSAYVYAKDLPDKALWPRLGELLEADEFYEHVEAADDGLLIQIKNWRKQEAV